MKSSGRNRWVEVVATLKIGELARATGVETGAIRYYEREGLLGSPRRTAGNYRSYDQTHVDRLLFIRRGRALDMSLQEIRTLLHSVEATDGTCDEVNALLEEHLTHVTARIRELRRLERDLKRLRAACAASRPVTECGILQRLTRARAEVVRRVPEQVTRYVRSSHPRER